MKIIGFVPGRIWWHSPIQRSLSFRIRYFWATSEQKMNFRVNNVYTHFCLVF